MHLSRVPFFRFVASLAAAVLLSSNAFAQTRPGGGGAGGNGGVIGGGGGNIGIGGGPIIIGGGGGGGGTANTDPTIVAPRGGLAGDTLTAAATIPGQPIAANPQPGGTTPTSSASYQWSITGGRITSDPRANPVQFVADGAGTVTLSVTINTNGTSYNPTAQVTIISADTAGTITAPATIATNTATLTASVPAAQSNDRTFRWSVSGDAAIASGQGTASVTLRPGTPGLKELTCNVIFQNVATVPVRAFLVVTGSGAPTTLTINSGSGGGTYPAGSRVDIFADAPAAGLVFDKWTGNTEVLGTGALAPSLAHAVITIPATATALTATYKAAPAWTPTVVQNFNPQTQTGANNQTTTVSTTLAYYVPANAVGLVFLVHDARGSAADWFNRPEPLLLARDLVAAGYGVAALSSINRTTGAWTAQPALANNLDALNHAAALDKLVRDGALAAAKPVFFLGDGVGGNAAMRFADQLATATPARPVKGAILYATPGVDTFVVTSHVPQFFALATSDDTLAATALTDARDNTQLLLGRGVATNLVTNGPSPIYPGRFRMLGLNTASFTSTDAQAVWTAVKNAGVLDANNYPQKTLTSAALTAALPAAYQARAADVASEIAVAAAGHEFFSDANARVIAFLNNRAADAAVPPPGRLVNLSTRTRIAFVGDTFSLGFNISGPQRATLLIRGIGPALAKFGVSTALAAPRLEINKDASVIAANEGWEKAANAAQIASTAATVGAFALAPGDVDAAVLLTLDPGTYTATIKGVNGTTGEALAEIYDVSRNATRLTNLSTLARINGEGDLLIPGIVIAGNNPRTLVVRAVAQGLADFGLSADTLLGDPRITILSGTQTVATNNNWAQAGAAVLNAAFPAVGAFPLRAAADAALLNALAPGSYTLQAGAAPVATPPAGQTAVAPNQTGSVLVEVYEVP